MGFGDPPDEVHRDQRVAAAVALAKAAIADPHGITDEDFGRLNAQFTREELATLCAFIAFISGANKFGILVGLTKNDLQPIA